MSLRRQLHDHLPVDIVEMKFEYEPGHERHGEINYFEYGKHLRSEFAPGHAHHGEIDYFQDGKFMWREYEPGHERHGEINYFEYGKHLRSEFAPWHAHHGEINYFKDGKFMWREYAPGHERHGEIDYFELFEVTDAANGSKGRARECVVCLTRTASHAAVPCGHLCLCASCYPKVGTQCPMCRAHVKTWLRIIGL
jgi:hypothetical protein